MAINANKPSDVQEEASLDPIRNRFASRSAASDGSSSAMTSIGGEAVVAGGVW